MRPIKAHARFAPGPAAFVFALLSLGCADDSEREAPEPPPKVWVGEVANSDVKIALADSEGTTTFFFCGGDTSYDTSTRWFNEPVLLKEPFSFMAHGWRVEGTVNDGVPAGVVQLDSGEESAWSAEPVEPDTAAGLYEGVAPCGKLGLIVTQPSAEDEPSGQGACIRIEDEITIIEQVNPVRLAGGAQLGITVTVSDSDEEFTVLPVVGAAR